MSQGAVAVVNQDVWEVYWPTERYVTALQGGAVYFCYCNGATPFLSKNRFIGNKASTFNGQIGASRNQSSCRYISCQLFTFSNETVLCGNR